MRQPTRHTVATLAALLVAAGLALTAPSPAATAPADRAPAPRLVEGEAWITVDGVDSDRNGRDDRVHVWWVRPAGGTAAPVVVEPSPYFAGGNPVRNHDVDVPLYVPGAGFDRAAPADGYDYLYRRHGYAYVWAESLGSGGSTGCPTTGDTNETDGVRAVVDWLTGRAEAVDADGEPLRARWSDGNVGMIGVSYNGTLANAAASTGVPGLKAIVPISAISHWYGYYRDDGAVIAPGGYQGEDADVLAKYVLTRARPDTCQPVIRALRRHQDRVTGDLSRFWERRDYRPDADQVRAAVLLQHGLTDWNVKTSQFATWYRALRAQGVPHRLWLHPDAHGDYPSYEGDRDWRRLVVRWFDHWLRGEPTGVMGGPRVTWTLPGGDHRRLDEFPDPASRRVALRPRPGGDEAGGLRLGAAGGGVERLVDDAAFNAKTLASRPASRHRLLYRTPRLDRPVVLSGTAIARLRVAFSAPAANVSVALVDVGPDGQVRLVTEGWTDPQNRTSASVTTPIEPGEAYDLSVALEPQQYLVQRGHRIGLVLLSSDHDFTLRPPPGTRLSVGLAGTRLLLPVTGGRAALAAALGRAPGR